MATVANEFGRLLKDWRRMQRRSQLTLALDAAVSARHLSFIENGRARPSREMVLKLVEALDVPLRERNNFLNAAGFASVYQQTTLVDDDLEPARRALQFMLDKHEPYPAFVVDRLWNLLMANTASQRLLEWCELPASLDLSVSSNMMKLTLHPDGLRGAIENWEDVANELLLRARREAAVAYGDDPLKALLLEVLDYPGVAALGLPLKDDAHVQPVVPLTIKWKNQRLSWLSIIATFGTPQDVTLQDLRLETMAPGDAATETFAANTLATTAS